MSNKLFMSSDYLFNHPTDANNIKKMYGEDIVPVDLNGAVVPFKKEDSQNFINAGITARRWFEKGGE